MMNVPRFVDAGLIQ
uniref:Uncharacterized protein n=1 Tax=Anguilla anguilla TaxID=7936 RepID=A0A0E9UG33_ANGAN